MHPTNEGRLARHQMVGSNTLNSTNHDFAAILRQRRRDLDLTRNELAKRVGCSADTIKKLEEGERRPSKELAELLAHHLHIEASQRVDFVQLARTRLHTYRELGPSNLPAPLTTFIGREIEAENIEAIIRRGDARLLTLMGPPGVGKSRLALYAAEKLRSYFPDGVWFIPLATVEAPDQVPLRITKTLQIAEENSGTPLDWLIAALAQRRTLLLLDNFEQILDAAPYITELLTACANVSALITSRTPLEVYGEYQFVVPPLAVPPANYWDKPAIIDDYTAVQLFTSRIRSHNALFQLTQENSPAVAELCARLDGIPLAIELAAGLTRAESPHLLLADVAREGRLALLSTNQRDRNTRQQTLREAIAWSVRRLSPTAQQLFAQLGVFHGSFDLDAAYAVGGAIHDQAIHNYAIHNAITPSINDATSQQDFATTLQSLVASHLIQPQLDNNVPRYRLLETLREYALDMLRGEQATIAAQRRHAQYFAELVYATDPAQTVGNLHQWRNQLRPDYSNLLAALQFALKIGDVALTLQLASGLGQFWYLEGSWLEAVGWLQQAIALEGGPQPLRVRAHTELGILYCAIGKFPEAEHYLHQALEAANQSGDLWAMGWILSHLGQAAILQGKIEITRTYTQERLQIYRRLGNKRYLAITLEQMGCAAVEEGNYERGVPWLEECNILWREQESPAGVASVNLIIGMAELAQGDAHTALARSQKAYQEFDLIQHSHGLAWSLRNLGLIYLVLGQLPQAQFNLSRSLERYTALTGSDATGIIIVEAVAGIAARMGKHHLAAHLMGAASVSREKVQMPLTENSRQIYDQLLAPSHKALGKEEWEKAERVGTTLPWAEALASAQSLLTTQSRG